jgi:hypothetical protein
VGYARSGSKEIIGLYSSRKKAEEAKTKIMTEKPWKECKKGFGVCKEYIIEEIELNKEICKEYTRYYNN